jgi:hypothetical protein
MSSIAIAALIPKDVMEIVLALLPALGWRNYWRVSKGSLAWLRKRRSEWVRRMAVELGQVARISLTAVEAGKLVVRVGIELGGEQKEEASYEVAGGLSVVKDTSRYGRYAMEVRRVYGWCRLALMVRRSSDATLWKEVALAGIRICPEAVMSGREDLSMWGVAVSQAWAEVPVDEAERARIAAELLRLEAQRRGEVEHFWMVRTASGVALCEFLERLEHQEKLVAELEEYRRVRGPGSDDLVTERIAAASRRLQQMRKAEDGMRKQLAECRLRAARVKVDEEKRP